MNENWRLLNFNSNNSHAIPSDKIALSIDDKNTRRITLNADISEKVRNEGLYYLEVYLNEFAPEAQFVFRKKQTRSSLTVPDDKKHRICINSKFLVEKLIEHMKLERRSQHLSVSENISNSPEYATFKLTKA